MTLIQHQKSVLDQANETEWLARAELRRIEAKYSLHALSDSLNQRQVIGQSHGCGVSCMQLELAHVTRDCVNLNSTLHIYTDQVDSVAVIQFSDFDMVNNRLRT